MDLTNLGLSLDSSWLNLDLSEKLMQLGFIKQVIDAKRSHLISSGQDRLNLGEWKEVVSLKDGWERPRAAARLRGVQ